MKTWVIVFLVLLVAGAAWGLARDLFSRERRSLSATVVSVDPGNPLPKWFPPTPPHLKARLEDGTLVDVAIKNPARVSTGRLITITEWVTPWGQVWYTQRD